MDKEKLKQNHFKYDSIHDTFYYERDDVEGVDSGEGKIHWFGARKERLLFKPNDKYRCEFLKNNRRIGKIHYDAVRFLYDDRKKPTLEIFVQGGMRMNIRKNEISLSDFEHVEDNNFFRCLPLFDTISFYGTNPLNMELKLIELGE